MTTRKPGSAEYETDRAKILAGYTPEFQDLHAQIGQLVEEVFGEAKAEQEFGIAAWTSTLADPPPKESWKGTMPNDHITVGPTEKKAGITIHVWHPKDPYILKKNADWLQAEGFKPMVGCLCWNRKAPMPLAPFEKLLRIAKDAS